MPYTDPKLRLLLTEPSGALRDPSELMSHALNRPYHIEVEIPMTGISYVDAVLMHPTTAKVISHPIIDRFHTIPYTAGGSVPLDEPTTYIDRNFPRSFTVRRLSDPSKTITFSPDAPLVIHENVEQTVMNYLVAAGFPHQVAYRIAHYKFAEVAEGAWYRHQDIDQEAAEKAYTPYLRKIQHEVPDNIPENLYFDPYPHDHPWCAQHESFKEPLPTKEQVAKAISVLRDFFDF